ncbi:glycosyltransferase [Paenibacillus sp. LMG 31460]|uniref:Glycosyltransferase n=1 Tax=Paenibacillus germinis TaxID=2654979 RepID=A0ABX1Z7L5_9BACL|nr:glycosyltransferase [Paenibacillus germinis]NOU87931.1 glycosyltransferase [Paenibacillus germinis]
MWTGRHILITTHSLVEFAGAEINVLSLAKEFIDLGNVVHVGAYYIGEPILSEFNNSNIPVFNLIHSEWSQMHYDLVWSQHATTLYQVLLRGIKPEKIIFSSLSPFEPLEFPPIFSNQLSLILANSEETRERLISEGVSIDNVMVFPNFATNDYFNSNIKHLAEKVRRICIISNHVPEELKLLQSEFYNDSIVLDIYGIEYINTLITPEILKNYDVIITIGKSVQFSLVMGIPVYCYDIHGGPGWIDETNYKIAKYYNFSGRGFDKKLTANEIKMEILEGYSRACSNMELLSLLARSEFNLSLNLKTILDSERLLTRNVDNNVLVEDCLSFERSHKAFLREYEYNRYYKSIAIEKEKKISSLLEELEGKNQQIDEYSLLNSELHSKISRLISNVRNQAFSLQKLSNELDKKMIINNDSQKQIELLTNSINEFQKQISQKDDNSNYLLNLSQELSTKLNEIQNTRAWIYAEKVRKLNIKLRKGIRNPNLIYKKILKTLNISSSSYYKKKVHVQQLYNNNEIPDRNPLISVVIPIYDRTDVLIESIDSILNQTYDNIEILLVCDGSPTKTLEIVKSYENNEKVKAFYFKNNSGNAVRGRNKAIKEARGEYLAFQDSDDIAELNRLELSLGYIQNYKCDVVYGGWRALLDGTRIIDLEDKQEVFSPECDYEFLKEICVPCQSTVMVRLSAIRHVGGLKSIMRYREDHELWLRLSYYGYKFKSIPYVLTNLRLHDNNLELTFKDNDNVWEKLTLEEHKIIRPLKPKIAYLLAGTGISGGLSVICKHANSLLDRGYDVSFITEDNSNTIEWYPSQLVNIIPIDNIPNNFDIIIATYWTTAYTLENIPSKRKLYFVQSNESIFFPEESNEYKAAYNTYTKDYEIITMAKWLQDWLDIKFSKDSYYVPNGVDPKIVYLTEPIEKKNNKIRILIEGPIDVPFKGIKEAFQVVEGLDCEIWCVSTSGTPDPSWKIDKYFEKVPFERMKYIYSSCDILLKMSKIESFCLPALEMMACGGICVLNKFNGIDEFVVNEYNALIVEQSDILGAKNAIIRIMENPDLKEKLSKNALETASNWNWDRSIDLLEEIILQGY